MDAAEIPLGRPLLGSVGGTTITITRESDTGDRARSPWPRSQIEELPPSLTPTRPLPHESTYEMEDKIDPYYSAIWTPERLVASCSYSTTFPSAVETFSAPTEDEAESLRSTYFEAEIAQLSLSDELIPSDDSVSSSTTGSLQLKQRYHEVTCVAYGESQWDWERLFGGTRESKENRQREKQMRDERSLEEWKEITQNNREAMSRRLEMFMGHLGRQLQGRRSDGHMSKT